MSFFRFLYKFAQLNIFYKINFFFFKKKIIKTYISSNLKNNFDEILKILKTDGIIHCKQFYQNYNISKIQKKFESHLNNNFDDFFYQIHPEKKDEAKNVKFNVKNIFEYTNYVMLKNPMKHFPDISIFLDENLSELLQNYFGTIPSLTSINVKRSCYNNLRPMGQNFYHRDENSIKFLKVFIYLNDVSLENGPFVYIKKSHSVMRFNDYKKYSFSDEEVEKVFPQENKFYATAKSGDVIIANTRGLHKGNKINRGYRDMITLNFGLHYEYFREKSALILPKEFKIPEGYKKHYFEHSKFSN
jgi:hypothetical protein